MNPSILQNHAAEVGRAMRNNRFERTPKGLLFPSMGVVFGGAMRVHDYRDNSDQIASFDANTLVKEGLNHFLNAAMPPTAGYTPITQWYIAPYSGNYTPDDELTAATFTGTATEFTDYTSGTRLALVVPSAATAQATGNTGSEALVVLNGDGPYNLYGAVIISSSAKSAVSGKMLAAVRFDNPRLNMASGDKLGLEYIITASDAG